MRANTLNTATIYHRDGREKTVDVHEASRMVGAGQVGAGQDWSLTPPPPPGWERETPKYRATTDLRPAPKARFRSEPPFSTISESGVWQYADRPIKTGEIIETTAWPHPTFQPLNYGAKKVLSFFNAAPKSRLPREPWFNGQVRLDDGLTSHAIADDDVRPPALKAMNLTPHRAA